MRLALLTAAVCLGGCTTVTPWPDVPVVDLCYYTLYGSGQNRSGAEIERQRRGVDCNPYYPAIIAREQQRNQSMQNALDNIRRAQQPAPMIQPTTVCRTIPSGNGYQTICN